MIKVAVLGSCVSRDSFNSKFISDYKNYFECVLHQNQMSMISLNSNPIPYEDKWIDNLSPFDANHFKTELNKSFFSKMQQHQPDYLIVDFYGDLFYGVGKIGDSYITNKKWLFQKTTQFKKFEVEEEFQIFFNESERYLQLWRNGIKALFNFLNNNVPHCKVVINKARFIDEYIDRESGEIRTISKSGKHKYINVPVYNKWWAALDNYVIKNYDVRVIDYENKIYKSIEEHPWGMFYCHYNMEFYQDFSRKFLGIIVNDFIKLLENNKKQGVSNII